MITITWITLVASSILIILSVTKFRRKAESEISTSVYRLPLFRIGAVLFILSIVTQIIIFITR